MFDDFERAGRYRLRAAELRALVDHWQEPLACEPLERLAKDFDALADRLDPFPRWSFEKAIERFDRRLRAG